MSSPSSALTTAPLEPCRRRRLFSRRELRHNGTYVVQVGSQNVLEKRGGRYTYAEAANNKHSLDTESCTDDPDAIVSGETPSLRLDHVASTADVNEPKGSKDPLHYQGRRRKMMHVSQGARRLLESSRNVGSSRQQQRHKNRRLTGITTVAAAAKTAPLDHCAWSPTQLPPPLDIDRSILSFPESPRASPAQQPLSAKSQRLRRPPPKAAAPTSSIGASASLDKRKLHLHLTPLREVSGRLRSLHSNGAPPPPPLFDLSKHPKP